MALLVGILLAVFVLPAPWDYVAVAAGGAVELGEAAFWWRWTHRARPVVGAEALLGRTAVVVDPRRVRLDGELWNASGVEGLAPGTEVRVTAVDGLTLDVSR